MKLKIKATCKTNGKGLWTTVVRDVQITGAELAYLNEEEDFGELRVYFTLKSWYPGKHGLIYTDPQWIKEFRNALQAEGFSKKAVKDVEYSEQGMQGNNYVSLDVSKNFLNEFLPTEFPTNLECFS